MALNCYLAEYIADSSLQRETADAVLAEIMHERTSLSLFSSEQSAVTWADPFALVRYYTQCKCVPRIYMGVYGAYICILHARMLQQLHTNYRLRFNAPNVPFSNSSQRRAETLKVTVMLGFRMPPTPWLQDVATHSPVSRRTPLPALRPPTPRTKQCCLRRCIRCPSRGTR